MKKAKSTTANSTKAKPQPSTKSTQGSPDDNRNSTCEESSPSWDACSVTAGRIDWPEWAVRNTVKLLEEDNTIPFIARYRKEQTNNMEADKIRELKHSIDDLR